MSPSDLFSYAYRKQPLHELYPGLADVPEAFLMEWFKDRYDCTLPKNYET
jgi:hypothetical protein